MTIWRLESLRLFRTLRWAGLLASYLVFGIVGPVLTRYQEEIFRNVGGGITMEFPSPTPGLAVAAYIGNVSQIALIVTVFIAAGSLAFDAKPEWAAFLRTRAGSLGDVVVPKATVMTAASSACFAIGAIATWIATSVLIDRVPTVAMLAGIGYWTLYLAFVISLVALAAGIGRSVVAAAALALVALLVLPIVAEVVPPLRDWSPSSLVGAMVDMVNGAPASRFLRAAAITAGLSATALWGSVRLLSRREV